MKKMAIAMLIALMGCSLAAVEPSATIEGKVSIGPLCGNIPVGTIQSENPCGLSNEAVDAFYGQYSVVLKNSKNALVTQKKLDRTGFFTFEVNEGNYTISVESSTINVLLFNQKTDTQKSLNISKSSKEYLVFNINTGYL